MISNDIITFKVKVPEDGGPEYPTEYYRPSDKYGGHIPREYFYNILYTVVKVNIIYR